MKKTLLFTKQNYYTFYLLLVLCLCFNFGWSQTNLVLNSALENHTIDVNDNADSFDMTPPTGIDGGSNNSPYRAIWNNSALDTWLGVNYSDTNEQPGSTSDGNIFGPKAGLGRGVKVYSPARRLYQKVSVTPDTDYTFFIDSRSEAENIPSEVFILNTEIADEVGLTSGSSTVDAYKLIDNDFNVSKPTDTEDTFTTTTFSFTATNNFVVIYVRALQSTNDGDHDVFYDNIELYDSSELSVNDVLASKVKVFPNPAKDYITVLSNNVQISSIEMYSVLSKKVLSTKTLTNNRLNVSDLSSGIYFMKINADGSSATKKVVIE